MGQGVLGGVRGGPAPDTGCGAEAGGAQPHGPQKPLSPPHHLLLFWGRTVGGGHPALLPASPRRDPFFFGEGAAPLQAWSRGLHGAGGQLPGAPPRLGGEGGGGSSRALSLPPHSGPPPGMLQAHFPNGCFYFIACNKGNRREPPSSARPPWGQQLPRRQQLPGAHSGWGGGTAMALPLRPPLGL